MNKKAAWLLLFPLLSFHLFGMSADEAYPAVRDVLSAIPIPSYTVYTVGAEDIEGILGAAADLGINFFELIDCMYRYLEPNNKRLEISGELLRNARVSFGYGGYPVEELLPIERMVRVQVGKCFTQLQRPLEMTLDAPYSVYIEVATAAYDTECGFTKIEPLNFLESYGMYIKKWNIVKPVRKIHLYEPGLGAVYAQGFFKPKLVLRTRRSRRVSNGSGVTGSCAPRLRGYHGTGLTSVSQQKIAAGARYLPFPMQRRALPIARYPVP